MYVVGYNPWSVNFLESVYPVTKNVVSNCLKEKFVDPVPGHIH